MKITSRFTVAVHTLLVIRSFQGKAKTTSEFIAASVNVNPVVIRRALQSLKAAGMVEVKAGSGGAEIIKPLAEISLYDVYKAADCVETNSFISMKIPTPPVPWAEIYTAFWTNTCKTPSARWKIR